MSSKADREKARLLSRLEKGDEVYEVVLDPETNQVFGVKKDRTGTVLGQFKKSGIGTTTPFAAMEQARRVVNKKKTEGFRETENHLKDFSDEVFKEEAGAPVVNAREQAAMADTGRTVSWYLNLALPELALRARQEIIEAKKLRDAQKGAAV